MNGARPSPMRNVEKRIARNIGSGGLHKLNIHYVRSEATGLKSLSSEEAAYLAGLVDGDGCVTITYGIDRYYQPTVQISLTNYFTIKSLCDLYGGSYSCPSRIPPRRAVYVWCWNYEMMKCYLPKILSFMFVKTEQTEILLDCLCTHQKWKNQDKLFFQTMYRRIRKLNQKGGGQ